MAFLKKSSYSNYQRNVGGFPIGDMNAGRVDAKTLELVAKLNEALTHITSPEVRKKVARNYINRKNQENNPYDWYLRDDPPAFWLSQRSIQLPTIGVRARRVNQNISRNNEAYEEGVATLRNGRYYQSPSSFPKHHDPDAFIGDFPGDRYWVEQYGRPQDIDYEPM